MRIRQCHTACVCRPGQSCRNIRRRPAQSNAVIVERDRTARRVVDRNQLRKVMRIRQCHTACVSCDRTRECCRQVSRAARQRTTRHVQSNRTTRRSVDRNQVGKRRLIRHINGQHIRRRRRRIRRQIIQHCGRSAQSTGNGASCCGNNCVQIRHILRGRSGYRVKLNVNRTWQRHLTGRKHRRKITERPCDSCRICGRDGSNRVAVKRRDICGRDGRVFDLKIIIHRRGYLVVADVREEGRQFSFGAVDVVGRRHRNRTRGFTHADPAHRVDIASIHGCVGDRDSVVRLRRNLTRSNRRLQGLQARNATRDRGDVGRRVHNTRGVCVDRVQVSRGGGGVRDRNSLVTKSRNAVPRRVSIVVHRRQVGRRACNRDNRSSNSDLQRITRSDRVQIGCRGCHACYRHNIIVAEVIDTSRAVY